MNWGGFFVDFCSGGFCVWVGGGVCDGFFCGIVGMGAYNGGVERIMYTYTKLCDDLAYLGYNGVDVGSVGVSECGLNIAYVHCGDYCGKQIIVCGGIHARENITSLLVIRQAFRAVFEPEGEIESGGIYFLPMLNPDGAMLIEKGLDFVRCNKKREQLFKINGESEDFSLWKANINGVDLNNNFDARFNMDSRLKSSPASQGYAGRFAFSERETEAIKMFTLSVRPVATISYHALGREIYYSFFQNEQKMKRDRQIACELNKVLDYRLVDGDLGSCGGYKDWCVDKLGIPSFTIEIISNKYSHPLNNELLQQDYEQNKNIPQLLLSIV